MPMMYVGPPGSHAAQASKGQCFSVTWNSSCNRLSRSHDGLSAVSPRTTDALPMQILNVFRKLYGFRF